MKKITIGFDVYGTLVDPLEIGQHLYELFGERSKQFAVIWRQKQLEYTFRRGLMDRYQDFDVCTQQALQYTMKDLGINFSSTEITGLLDLYKTLQPFPDVIPALKKLKNSNYSLVAFSNGVKSTLNTLLSNAKLFKYFADVISVDAIQTFKPNPKVYKYLATQTKTDLSNCWVVSSNPFDVIGGKSAGIHAAWIQRDINNTFDPWEYEPDLKAKDLIEFSQQLIQNY